MKLITLTSAILRAILCFIDPNNTPKICGDNDDYTEALIEKVKSAVGEKDGTQRVNITFHKGEEKLYQQFVIVCEKIESNFSFFREKDTKITDRFFLEETVHRLKNKDMEYVETLTSDWLQEMVEKIPLTEEERTAFIKDKLGWDEDFTHSAYFKSEKTLVKFLKGE